MTWRNVKARASITRIIEFFTVNTLRQLMENVIAQQRFKDFKNWKFVAARWKYSTAPPVKALKMSWVSEGFLNQRVITVDIRIDLRQSKWSPNKRITRENAAFDEAMNCADATEGIVKNRLPINDKDSKKRKSNSQSPNLKTIVKNLTSLSI